MEGNTFVADILVSLECIIITVLLFFLYIKRLISAIELIMYSIACSTFFIPFISNTITPQFFVSTYFFLSEATALLRGKLPLRRSLIIVLILPLASTVVVGMLILVGVDVFGGINPSFLRVLYDGVFFYLKYFLPIVFLGTRLYREGKVLSADYFFDVLKKVAIISCCVALFQLAVSFFVTNEVVLRVIGMRPVYLSYTTATTDSSAARVSALFVEPKYLASYLVVVLPLFFRDKKIIPIFLILIVGIFTASQTFVVGTIICVINFVIIRKIRNIRVSIFLALFILLGTLFTIANLKQVLFDFYIKNSDNYLVNLVLARAIDRYDVTTENPDNKDFVGLPLQKDSELPISNFFEDRPWLYVSGYGLKNGGFIPPRYFIFNDEGFRTVGMMTYNMDLRWYYFICEFGVIVFFVWLVYFTRRFNPKAVSLFQRKYYAFLIIFLFFNGVELMVIMVYSIYAGNIYRFNEQSESAQKLITRPGEINNN